MTEDELSALARQAHYVGSSHHTDVPKWGIVPAPRQGAVTAEQAAEQGIDNPDCTLCPRKWLRLGQDRATELLRDGIRLGQVSADAMPKQLPKHVWVRDPDNADMIYEARRLSTPSDGYKAFPLSSKQVRLLPITVR